MTEPVEPILPFGLESWMTGSGYPGFRNETREALTQDENIPFIDRAIRRSWENLHWITMRDFIRNETEVPVVEPDKSEEAEVKNISSFLDKVRSLYDEYMSRERGSTITGPPVGPQEVQGVLNNKIPKVLGSLGVGVCPLNGPSPYYYTPPKAYEGRLLMTTTCGFSPLTRKKNHKVVFSVVNNCDYDTEVTSDMRLLLVSTEAVWPAENRASEWLFFYHHEYGYTMVMPQRFLDIIERMLQAGLPPFMPQWAGFSGSPFNYGWGRPCMGDVRRQMLPKNNRLRKILSPHMGFHSWEGLTTLCSSKIDPPGEWWDKVEEEADALIKQVDTPEKRLALSPKNRCDLALEAVRRVPIIVHHLPMKPLTTEPLEAYYRVARYKYIIGRVYHRPRQYRGGEWVEARDLLDILETNEWGDPIRVLWASNTRLTGSGLKRTEQVDKVAQDVYKINQRRGRRLKRPLKRSRAAKETPVVREPTHENSSWAGPSQDGPMPF